MYSFCIDLTKCNKDSLKENCLNDFELIKSFYLDSLDPIEQEEGSLIFKLNLKLEMSVDSNVKEIIKIYKFSNLLTSDSEVGLPYWLKFSIDFDRQILCVSAYVFWMKRRLSEFEIFREQYNNNVEYFEESIFFTISENFRNFLTPPDKSVLLNWLQEMKEECVIKSGDEIIIDQIVFDKFHKMSLGNEKEGDFECNNDNANDESQKALIFMKARSDKRIEKMNKKVTSASANQNEAKEEEEDNSNLTYTNFFKQGGIVGDILTDRGSTFQSHAIKIHSMTEMKKHLQDLNTNNKIGKATHNILAYRIADSSNVTNNVANGNKTKKGSSKEEVTEGFDDDGESGAGMRLLGILQKMKIVNFMVVVSRWFGGTLLGQDRFKHINDSAKNLIMANKTLFDFQH